MLPVVGGTYEVVEKLREGGMGAIYRVRHLLLDEPRVIKVMRASVEEDLHARERFLREAQMARRLSHPSIAVLHDLAEARPGTFYMVMELIDGPSLSDVLGAGRLLPVSVLLDLGAQALDGLQYLHDRGIIHRDVSPENLMVAEVAGRPALKIIDLGVAKREDEEGLTTTGVFVGKLRYASPEQLGSLKKGETIDGRSDVYSLGCVLYNLLTGSPAYLAETPQAWIRQHVLERPRPFATTDRTYRVPEPVRHAVLRALSKDRNARFSGAAEFASTLRGLTEALVREGGREAEARDLAESRSVLAQAHQAGARKGEPATVEDLAASGLLSPPAESRLVDGPVSGVEEATVRISSPSKAAPRSPETGGSRRARTGVALAAGIALLGTLATVWFSRRAPGPSLPAGPAATGELVLNASPWGRVVSVVEESTGAAFEAGAAVTPCRVTLPSGRWRIVVRGADGAEAAATVVVQPGRPSAVHLDLPGFDTESAVRSFVPDGT
ncbi:MAG: serine/threonine protein kinase [Holophagales bacterium]|nr:serine/threonine protein kinase [Holophagales bacterium]